MLEPAPIKRQAATARVSFGRGRSTIVPPNAGPKWPLANLTEQGRFAALPGIPASTFGDKPWQ
jgi:hypothetical protein